MTRRWQMWPLLQLLVARVAGGKQAPGRLGGVTVGFTGQSRRAGEAGSTPCLRALLPPAVVGGLCGCSRGSWGHGRCCGGVQRTRLWLSTWNSRRAAAVAGWSHVKSGGRRRRGSRRGRRHRWGGGMWEHRKQVGSKRRVGFVPGDFTPLGLRTQRHGGSQQKVSIIFIWLKKLRVQDYL